MDGVVLLHGHGRTGLAMGFFAQALRRAGHATLAPSYGFRRAMPAILERIGPDVERFAGGLPGQLHFVTHSLGGLVARALIARHRPPKLGRVVMLGTPNQGSELADLLFRLNLSAAILGPVAGHLTTLRSAADEALLGQVDYPLGIVAGNRSLTPVPRRLLPPPHDGMVSVAATKLAGMADHIVLPVPHSLLCHHPQSIAQALHFLAHGHFAR
jgi:pimeloyl-ACP methyl ester carboxylesterase